MWKRVLFYFLLLTLVYVSEAHTGARLEDSSIYFLHTGEQVTAAWDAIETATRYECQIYFILQSLAYPLPSTQATKITFVLPRTGPYILKVRACNNAGCSLWAESNKKEFATINGEPRGWILYGSPAPAGGIEIEDESIP